MIIHVQKTDRSRELARQHMLEPGIGSIGEGEGHISKIRLAGFPESLHYQQSLWGETMVKLQFETEILIISEGMVKSFYAIPCLE